MHRVQPSLLCLLLCLCSVRASACENPAAQLTAIDDQAVWAVNEAAASEQRWETAKTRQSLCPGSVLRVGASSRVLLQLDEETVVRLAPGTVLVLPEARVNGTYWVKLKQGLARFLTRVNGFFQVSTPFVNAAVEGTEFLVWVEESQTGIQVFEGRVTLPESSLATPLNPGEAALADSNRITQTPALSLSSPKIEWALYLPWILDEAPVQVTGETRESRIQDLAQMTSLSESQQILQAQLLIASGQLENADSLLKPLITGAAPPAEALALASLIASARQDADQAQSLAVSTLKAAPERALSWVVASNASQVRSDWDAALIQAKRATEKEAQAASGWFRLAEVYLYLSEVANARDALDEGLKIRPGDLHGQALHALISVFEHRSQRAITLARAVIETDPTLPMSYVALALAEYRQGRAIEARRELDKALALAPGNALYRRLQGQIFLAEGQAAKAREQWALAQAAAPNDPMPHFYQALQSLLDNQPLEAARSLQAGREKMGQRSQQRNAALLASDKASLTAAEAEIYRKIGADFQSANLGHEALRQDARSSQAHQLLADSARELPFLQAASVSERLQSLLWQPLGTRGLSPQLQESDVSRIQSLGPERAGLDEYHPLMVQDGLSSEISGFAGSDDTRSHDVTLNMLGGPVNVGVGHYRYTNDGFRINGDQTQEIASALAQWEFHPGSMIQFETRHLDWTFGDLGFLPDPDSQPGTLRTERDVNTQRIGLRHQINQSTSILVSGLTQRFEEVQRDNPTPTRSAEFSLSKEVRNLEMQLVHTEPGWQSITGLAARRNRLEFESRQTLEIAPGVVIQANSDSLERRRYQSAYQYVGGNLTPNLTLNTGLEYSRFRERESNLKEDQWSPKVGLLWKVNSSLQIRAAGFRYFKRDSDTEQSIEPTQFNGFFQLYDDPARSDSHTSAIGLDWLGPNYDQLTVEAIHREIDFPNRIVDFTATERAILTSQRQNIVAAYYAKPINQNWNLSLGGQFYQVYEDLADRFPSAALFQEIRDLKMVSFPAAVTYLVKRWKLKLAVTHYRQSIRYASFNPLTLSNELFDKNRNAWVGDVSLEYSLPQAAGQFILGVQNVGDVKTEIVRPDEDYWQFYPRRYLFGRVSLSL